eukprot:2211318-Rhodomonas_salina.1
MRATLSELQIHHSLRPWPALEVPSTKSAAGAREPETVGRTPIGADPNLLFNNHGAVLKVACASRFPELLHQNDLSTWGIFFRHQTHAELFAHAQPNDNAICRPNIPQNAGREREEHGLVWHGFFLSCTGVSKDDGEVDGELLPLIGTIRACEKGQQRQFRRRQSRSRPGCGESCVADSGMTEDKTKAGKEALLEERWRKVKVYGSEVGETVDGFARKEL